MLLGSDAPPVMPPAARAITAAVPNARMIEVDAAGHAWSVEVMAPILADFLAG